MSPTQPTNQPTGNMTPLPEHYLSVRIKVSHDKEDVVLSKIVFDCPSYCYYKHTTSSEHFHVCMPGLTTEDGTRIGKRIRDNFGGSGNGLYSTKCFTSGCAGFVFYCGHEGTPAVYKDERWKEIIESTTQYYVKREGQTMLPLEKSKSKDQDSDWQLTYANVVPKAINHARRKGLTGSLKETLQDMLETTKWRPSYHMVKNGVPDHYYKDYEFRCGKRTRMDMSWMDLK